MKIKTEYRVDCAKKILFKVYKYFDKIDKERAHLQVDSVFAFMNNVNV